MYAVQRIAVPAATTKRPLVLAIFKRKHSELVSQSPARPRLHGKTRGSCRNEFDCKTRGVGMQTSTEFGDGVILTKPALLARAARS